MTLDYHSPPRAQKTAHDHIYTTLLAVFAFFLLIGVGSLIWIRTLPNPGGTDRSALLFPIIIESMYVVASIAIVIRRIAAPRVRRWPTFALNCILIPMIPLGTALAIYGFWKVDKNIASREQSAVPTTPLS